MMESYSESRAAELAQNLPRERHELLDIAAQAVIDRDSAVLAGDAEALALATDQYEAVVWSLNGGTFFGCYGGPDGGGEIAANHCAAAPGIAPRWAQSGSFLITVDGIRAWVDASYGLGRDRMHFEFRAVDTNTVFISPTGYRSIFTAFVFGETLEDVARALFADQMATDCVAIAPEGIARIEDQELPEWIADLPTPAIHDRQRADQNGQIALGF